MALRTKLSVSLAIPVCFLAACGGGGESYRIPADHPIKPFEKPDREELIEEEEDAWDIDYDEIEEEGGEESGGAGESTESDKGEGGASPADEPSNTGSDGPETELEGKGYLDKNIIRRYIRRELAPIENCYEQELAKDPSLRGGTVDTTFVIGRDGQVEEAEASGIGNEKVEECVAGVIRSIQFPEPEGDGEVNVKYPFHFR